MSTTPKIPEGWRVKNFSVALKPGKPEGATSWFDVQGRPALLQDGTWRLDPRLQQAQAHKPTSEGIKLSPEEQESYNALSSIPKEKLKEATRKSYFPNPDQAKRDEDNRRTRFAPYTALSEDQLSSIGAYTAEWDWNMNSLLREGKIKLTEQQRFGQKQPPSEAQVKKAITDLTSALEQLPDAPEGSFQRAVSGSVWNEDSTGRRASEFIEQLQGLEEGDVIDDPGFSSFTSAGAPVVDRFLKGDQNSDQNIVFEVKSSKMKDISAISKYQQEHEHMLPPGARFKVLGKTTSWSRKAGNHTVIKLQHI